MNYSDIPTRTKVASFVVVVAYVLINGAIEAVKGKLPGPPK